ncbi:unnamed protein product [Pedinophyceae sp. YPF-701]|nr:unnamed protein product [Pedinophyceae sp. YPF-701]
MVGSQPPGGGVAERLSAEFPCRDAQIKELLSRVLAGGRDARDSSQGCVAPAPLLVCGPRSTGKTAVVRAVFEECGARCAFVNCALQQTDAQVAQAIVDQLLGPASSAGDDDAPTPLVRTMDDMCCALAERIPCDEPLYIVVDEADRLEQLKRVAAMHEAVPYTLSRMPQLTGLNCGVVFITRRPSLRGPGAHEAQGAEAIAFQQYTGDELKQVLVHMDAAAHGGQARKSYVETVRTFHNALMRTNRCLRELRAAFSELHAFVEDRLTAAGGKKSLASIFTSAECRARAGQIAAALSEARFTRGANGARLDLQLPVASKLVLIAAYVASRNPKRTDVQVFPLDADGPRKRRKVTKQSHDRAVEAAQAAEHRARHAFTVERLAYVVQGLLKAEGADLCPDLSSGDLLEHVASLAAHGLLAAPQGVDALDTTAEYRSCVTDRTAEDLAKNMQLKLHEYLRLA